MSNGRRSSVGALVIVCALMAAHALLPWRREAPLHEEPRVKQRIPTPASWHASSRLSLPALRATERFTDESITSQDVPDVRRVVREYRQERNSAFFRRETFVKELPAGSPDVVHDLAAFLDEVADLERLDTRKPFAEAQPDILLDRMASIDLLESLSISPDVSLDIASAAQATLRALVKRDLSSHPHEGTRKILAAEKMDALAALARNNTASALQLFSSIDDHAQTKLMPALMMGLLDSGMGREAATKLITRARSGS